MRRTCISAMMAVVLVVTGAGTARAQEEAGSRLKLTITPAMARALSVQQPNQGSTTSRGRTGSKVKAAVAFGLIGMGAGAAIGSQATRNCGCEGGPGGLYGVLIGTPLGAWFGVWLAGR